MNIDDKNFRVWIGCVLLSFLLFWSQCTRPDKDAVYGPNQPDPYPINESAASLTKIAPSEAYPTQTITVSGSNFDVGSPDRNFMWFQTTRAIVQRAWAESLRVEVPVPNPSKPNYFFKDTVRVKIALKGSTLWSNSLLFKYKPMADTYVASVYPANHPEDKFTKPRGLAFDPSGNLYLVNNRLRSIYKDAPAGGERTVYAFGGKFDGGMRMGSGGFLYAAGNLDNVVYRIPPGGGSYESWASVPNPWGLDFDSAGNLFVVDNVNGHVYKITADRQVKKVATLPGNEAKGYCRVFNGNVYVNEEGTGNFFKMPTGIDSTGTVEKIQGVTGFVVRDFTFGADGSIYASGSQGGKNAVVKLSPSSQTSTVVTFDGSLMFMTWGGKFLYIGTSDGPIYRLLIHDNAAAPYYGM